MGDKVTFVGYRGLRYGIRDKALRFIALRVQVLKFTGYGDIGA